MKIRFFLASVLVTKLPVRARSRQTAKRAVQLLHLPCIFLLCMSCATGAQDAGEPSFTLKQVGPNVWAAISNPKSKAPAGANTGFVIGDDGVAVIDTSASADADGNFGTETAKEILAAIRTLTKLPVRFVINTHYHLDHLGANAVFVDAGAIVLAHRNVRGWIHCENLRMFGKDIKPQQKTFIEALVPPAVTYDQPAGFAPWLSRDSRTKLPRTHGR
jgi:cyclase